MYKKIIYRILAIFLFVFISVSFLIPSDLNAETRKFWVDTSHYETEKEWVDTSHFKIEGHWEDQDFLVKSGYFKDTQEKKWVDTSHMVYQGYWKNFTEKVWVDTSKWVSSGYWKDVTERVWVKSGYTAYRNVKKWVNTSHLETRSYRVWVDTSHSEYVRSGYWRSYWVNTSHWVTRYRNVRQAYRVYIRSGYWKWYWSGWRLRRRWINTSHWVTRYRNVRQAYRVYVRSGYWARKWIDTSHWTWVKSGYWKTIYYKVWIKSGYWKTVREPYYIDTSHWENQKVWVGGHYETRYREVENWEPCNVTFVFRLMASEPKNVILSRWRTNDKTIYRGTINGKTYKYKKHYYEVLPGNNLFSLETIAHPWVIFKIKYICFEVLNWGKESYSVWVGGYWKRKWLDTSHWVKSGHWQYYTYKIWVDTSYMKSEGHWETVTKRTWVDTSHWETKKVWVDKSHWVSSGYWKNNDVWVEEGHWVEADLDPEGMVLHTDQWNENRINYNLSITGDPDNPRGYEIFFNGEKFVLECDTPGDFQPESLHVEFLGTKFETGLTNTGDSKWEGYIWDKSFIYFHDRECVFNFTASYDYNGDKFDIGDEVTVYIVRDYYWQLHRGF